MNDKRLYIALTNINAGFPTICGDLVIKVGCAKNPWSRIDQLNTDQYSGYYGAKYTLFAVDGNTTELKLRRFLDEHECGYERDNTRELFIVSAKNLAWLLIKLDFAPVADTRTKDFYDYLILRYKDEIEADEHKTD